MNFEMRGRRKTTLLNLCFQAYSVGLTLASGILLVPLYLHHIPSNLYGAWQASGNVLTWMTVLDPGLSTILQQRVAVAYGSRDKEAVSGWIASGLWITVALSLVIFIAGLVSSFFLASWMKLGADLDQMALARAFRWSAAGSALMILSFSVTAANQGLQSSLGIGSVFVVVSMLRFVMVIVLVTKGYGLLAIAMPSVVMGLLLLLGNLVYLRARLGREGIPFSWVPTRLRELSGLISFTSFGRLASVLANNVDLFLVARILGPETVNVLRFTRTAPEMSRMLVERPFAAVQPSLSHLLGAGGLQRAREVLVRMLRLTIWLLALLVSGFIVFNGDFVRLWVGKRFYGGTSINIVLIVWFFVSVSMSVLSALCFSAGDIRGTSMVGGVQALVYLPLLWIGGHFWGLRGVLGASVISVIATQGWYMPRAFCRIYGIVSDVRVRLLKTLLLAGCAGAVADVLFGFAPARNWPMLVVRASEFVGCYIVVLLSLSSEARCEAKNVSLWVTARLRSTESTGGV